MGKERKPKVYYCVRLRVYGDEAELNRFRAHVADDSTPLTLEHITPTPDEYVGELAVKAMGWRWKNWGPRTDVAVYDYCFDKVAHGQITYFFESLTRVPFEAICAAAVQFDRLTFEALFASSEDDVAGVILAQGDSSCLDIVSPNDPIYEFAFRVFSLQCAVPV